MNELKHHGIKGQKWGVRRFQNDDGTLTSEGKQRYSVSGFTRDTKSRSGTSGQPSPSSVGELRAAQRINEIRTERLMNSVKSEPISEIHPKNTTMDTTTKIMALVGAIAIGGALVKAGINMSNGEAPSEGDTKAKKTVERVVGRAVTSAGKTYIRRKVVKEVRNTGDLLVDALKEVNRELESTRR